jgi:hypothetical protein
MVVPEVGFFYDGIDAVVFFPEDVQVKLFISSLHVNLVDGPCHMHEIGFEICVADHTWTI